MKQTLCGMLLLVLAWSSANATLISRAGGAAYYDDSLNITWVQDANLARTRGFDADGLMEWGTALAFIGTLNTAGYLGVTNWRLPTMTDLGAPGPSGGPFSGGDNGYNVDIASGEMAHLHYGAAPLVGLGNIGYYNTSGGVTGCLTGPAPNCFANANPFSNVNTINYDYWYGQTVVTSTNFAWTFGFYDGNQASRGKTTLQNAWAVASGDFATVPVPGAVWLFGGALAVLGAVRRKAIT